jgi:hypothetical protein
MSILVVCPGCHKRFKVNDKVAGKSGGCPHCRATIRVPGKGEEVTVHAPTEFAGGGRSTAGKLVLKPIARRETRLSAAMAAVVGGGALVALLVAWLGGKTGILVGQGTGGPQANPVFCAIGLLLITPPLVVGAYSFLRDDELEPYQGTALYVRSAICSLSYVGLWGVYGYVAGTALSGELWQWFFILPPFLVSGALVALACLDLEFGSSFFHYVFYVMITALLGWVAGIRLLVEAGTEMVS